MNPELHNRIYEIFSAAVEIGAAEQAAFLDANCAGDAHLRAAVQALLDSDKDMTREHFPAAPLVRIDFGLKESNGSDGLPGGAGDSAAAGERVGVEADADAEKIPPSEIHGCTIVREIHRGGQGVVYEAHQKSTGRRVAIKVLHDRPATTASRGRFEREVMLAAGLKHPNIVTVHDSGLAIGDSVIVMDYVEGERLDTYLQKADLRLTKKLKLFQTICEAVGYAHDRQVIHRDLKPSNILVDSEGNPRLVDFGLAKHMSKEERTTISRDGQLLGTLPYMSPEQTQGETVDIRTDVYSLGVILYEAFTGKPPYVLPDNWPEAIRTICEVEPEHPSRINRRIGNELGIIILKCLEKGRGWRYASAGDLARDIGHYLNDEPITAKRGCLYHLQKGISRHRRPLSVGAGVLLIILTAILITAESWERANAQQTKRTHGEYSAAIRSGSDDLRAGNAAKAATGLKAAPESQRGWEWRHLFREAHPAVLRLQHAPRTGGWSLRDPFVEFSPDGTGILSASTADDTIKWWNVETGKEIAVLPQDIRVRSIALSPDGEQIAWVTKDGAGIAIWKGDLSAHLTTIPIRSTLPASNDAPESLIFSGDGTSLVGVSEGGPIYQWATATGEQTTLRKNHPGRVATIAFTARGIRIVTCEDNNQVAIWGADQNEAVAVLQEQAGSVTTAAISPDGAHVALGTTAGRISTWNIDRKQMVWSLDSSRPSQTIVHLCWSPNGKWIASGDTAGTTRLCESTTGRLAETFSLPPLPAGDSKTTPGPVSSLAFSSDVSRLATAYGDNSIVVWDVQTGREELALWAHSDEVKHIAFSTDGARIASVSQDGTVRVFDTASGTEPVRLHRDRGSDTNQIPAFYPKFARFHPRGDWLALACNMDGVAGPAPPAEVEIYSLTSGENLFTCQIEGRCVSAPAFNADGTELGCISNWGLRTWNTSTPEKLVHKPWQRATTWSAVLDLPTKTFLTVTADGPQLTINVGGTSNQERPTRCGWAVQPPAASARFVPVVNPSFAHKDDIILGVAGDTIISLDLPNRRVHRGSRLQGPMDSVTCAAVTPDCSRLVTGSSNGIIQFWEPVSGWEVASFPTSFGGVTTVTFSPDGSRLAMGTARGYISIWDTVSRAQRLAAAAPRSMARSLGSRPARVSTTRQTQPASPIIPLRTERGETEIPIAASISTYAFVDTALRITLQGKGRDDSDLIFTLTSKPAHGTLGQVNKISRDAATITYTPEPSFSGEDSFSYTVRNGDYESPPAHVRITVQPSSDEQPSTVNVFQLPAEKILRGPS